MGPPDRVRPTAPADANGDGRERFALAPHLPFRTYLRNQALATLPPLLKTVSVIYAGLALSHWALFPADLALPFSLSAAAAVAFSQFALYFARRRPAHAVNAHLIGGSVGLLCILNSLLHLELTWEPQQTTNLLLVVVALGAFALHRAVAYGSALLGGILWCYIASEYWSDEWRHYGFALCLAFAVMAVTFESRVRLYASLYRTELALREQATTDRLTGLPNRTYLIERLEQLVERSRAGSPLHFGVCFVDVDDLKRINDDLGHAAGDAVLRVVADRLRGQCRYAEPVDIDLAGRLGGDEFLVIFDDIASPDELETVRLRVAGALSRERPHLPGAPPISASVGACWSCDVPNLSVQNLLARADKTMYREKKRGRRVGDKGVQAADRRPAPPAEDRRT